VGEEDGPAITDEIVKVNLALRRQGFEVGGYRAEPQTRLLLLRRNEAA
jgi:hypothetical protein